MGSAVTLRYPQASRSQDGECNSSAKLRPWLLVILFSAVFLQRFAVPGGTPLSLFVTVGATGLLFLRGMLNIDPLRCAILLLFAAYSLVSTTFNGDRGSWLSATLVIAMYIPFVFVIKEANDRLFTGCLHAFQYMILACAIFGIAQFFLQYAVSSKLLYTFEGFLPPAILLKGFDNLLPISYGSPLNRSNGFFMVEPSTFSQFVALAIIIELLFFQVKGRLLIFGVSLLCAYSGTGLIVLVLVPAILLRRQSIGTMAVLLAFVGLAAATSQLWHMDVIGQRAAEFGSGESSAHARYFAPADLVAKYLLSDPEGLLFGMGPGSLRQYIELMPYETHDPTWAKLLFEYGVFGSLLFWALFVVSVFSRVPSIWLSTALTIGYLSFGGELLDPRLVALLIVFCVLPKRAAPKPAVSFLRMRAAAR